MGVTAGIVALNSQPFIVAEVSKSWVNGLPANGSPFVLAELFEQVIEHNRQRGYRLHSFDVHRLMTRPDELNETLIAVFELDAPWP
jgi:hypothetical protein